MPTAWDRGTPASDHDPNQQLSVNPGYPQFDILDILDQWIQSIEDFIIPAFRQLLNLDLSALAALNPVTLIQEILAQLQLLIDTLFQALTGSDRVLNTFEDLALALLNIPARIVGGVLGALNIGDSVTQILNFLVGGLVGQPGEGATLPDAFNIALEISRRASQGGNAWEVLGYRNNTPVDSGMLPSSESNYNLTVINTDLNCTQSASLIGIMRVQRSAPLGVVSWRGYGVSGVTAFYVNIWKIDATTGDWSLVHHSPNIVGDLDSSSTPVPWQFYDLATPLPRVQGEDYAYELVSVGGTHHVRGFNPTDDIADHPRATVVALAATRNNTSPTTPPATIVKASVVRSNNIPWIETAIDSGNASDQHDPQTIPFTTSGSWPIPSWANFIDVIPVGAGGGGRQGTTAGIVGEGGGPGLWNPTTWKRGTDFTTETSVEFVRGEGGEGGAGFGAAGGASTFTVGSNTVSAAGGPGGTALGLLGNPVGRGPGQYPYNGQYYAAGGDQNASGAAGVAPGGGGAGGNGLLFQAGGNGAPGAGWVRFRQNPLNGEVVGTDEPPTPPTSLTVDEATFSTATVSWSGATD